MVHPVYYFLWGSLLLVFPMKYANTASIVYFATLFGQWNTWVDIIFVYLHPGLFFVLIIWPLVSFVRSQKHNMFDV